MRVASTGLAELTQYIDQQGAEESNLVMGG